MTKFYNNIELLMNGGKLMIHELNHEMYMKVALSEAVKAGERGDLPIGAVIVHHGKIISHGSNHINTNSNQVAHAEIDAIHRAAPYLREYARECVLYTTLEPCVMCLPTIVMANIRNIVYALDDHYMYTKQMISSADYLQKRVYNYIGGVLAEESLQLLKSYDTLTADLALYGESVLRRE